MGNLPSDKKCESWVRGESLRSYIKEARRGLGIKTTHTINWLIYHEWMDGEKLSEYITKVNVIYFHSIPVDFIDHGARNEQQGNQLNLNVSVSSTVWLCSLLIKQKRSGWQSQSKALLSALCCNKESQFYTCLSSCRINLICNSVMKWKCSKIITVLPVVQV